MAGAFFRIGMDTHVLLLLQGNYYASVPVEADCYLMKNVMHQMSDEHCRTVLNNIKAGARNATIVDIDNVLPGPNEGPAQKTMDVSMMVSGIEGATNNLGSPSMCCC